MESKTNQLDQLFIEWEENINGYKGKFVKDGIINETNFNEISPKILFITKEPNNPKQVSGDFREEWSNQGALYPFSRRIAEWSYGILNKFPPFNDIYNGNPKKLDNYKESLKKIAFMNLRKIGGKGTSEITIMLETLRDKKIKEYIIKEIDIIKPDIIILGLSWVELRNELIKIENENVQWFQSGYQIELCKWKDTKVIDFYHPSSRIAPAASYSLLQNVVKSNAFRTKI